MSRYDDEIDDHMRHNENPGTSNQPPMPDNMKGLLDELERGILTMTVPEYANKIKRLRTAVQGMELQLQLTQAEHASCHDEAAHHKRETWQAEIKELKRRLEGAHFMNCSCRLGMGGDDSFGDPRCHEQREIKKEE